MEDKLKTLEDFESHIEESIHNRLCKDLRQEAIKWYHRSDGNKHTFIRKFFNITEDEIKRRKE